MEIFVVKCSFKALQETIKDVKDNGRRILAVSPSKMKNLKDGQSVTEFVVISQ